MDIQHIKQSIRKIHEIYYGYIEKDDDSKCKDKEERETIDRYDIDSKGKGKGKEKRKEINDRKSDDKDRDDSDDIDSKGKGKGKEKRKEINDRKSDDKDNDSDEDANSDKLDSHNDDLLEINGEPKGPRFEYDELTLENKKYAKGSWFERRKDDNSTYIDYTCIELVKSCGKGNSYDNNTDHYRGKGNGKWYEMSKDKGKGKGKGKGKSSGADYYKGKDGGEDYYKGKSICADYYKGKDSGADYYKGKSSGIDYYKGKDGGADYYKGKDKSNGKDMNKSKDMSHDMSKGKGKNKDIGKDSGLEVMWSSHKNDEVNRNWVSNKMKNFEFITNTDLQKLIYEALVMLEDNNRKLDRIENKEMGAENYDFVRWIYTFNQLFTDKTTQESINGQKIFNKKIKNTIDKIIRGDLDICINTYLNRTCTFGDYIDQVHDIRNLLVEMHNVLWIHLFDNKK